MAISLLTNTGLQFYSNTLTIDISKRTGNTLYFWQQKIKNFFDESESIILHAIYKDRESDKFYPYAQLNFGENGELLTTDFTTIKEIDEEEVIAINDIGKAIHIFKDKWMPVPFFNKNPRNENFIFGPSGWARMFMQILDNKETEIQISLTFAFDTTLHSELEERILLHEIDTNPDRNLFSLCSDTHLNMRFLKNDGKNEWVEESLKVIAQKQSNHGDESMKYLADFLYLIQFLANSKVIPEVFIFKSNLKNYINVDLVLDIGNSRTCGLIFEDSMEQGSHNFTSVKKLKIRNLSEPHKTYEDPFSMNLTFYQSKFGNISIPSYQNLFSWPSVLRLGDEAQMLLNKFDVSRFKFDEPMNTISSPKRYLWDKTKSVKPWEYLILPENQRVHFEKKDVFFDSLTNFLDPNGQILENATNTSATWSKSSLMIFVFVEILNHANSQINSFDFRGDNDGETKKLRKLRSVIITCPTAMSEFEQYELREAANKAILLLEKYKSEILKSTDQSNDSTFDFSDLAVNSSQSESKTISSDKITRVEIIPRPKDIKISDENTQDRKDWIYDEASCSQINFIYSEIAKKYSNNFKEFFNIYGSKGNSSKPSISVATLDIGGGTTDLMVSRYSYDENEYFPYLTPNPIFYETFNTAGDDLLKEVVHQLLIDGADKYDSKGFGIGQIRKYAESIGCPNITDNILGFFSEHAAYHGAIHKFYRKYFVKQILIPIANKLLNTANGPTPNNRVFSFDEIFSDNPPHDSLILYINEKFGYNFDFKAIQWEFSIDRINAIIDYKFKDLFKQISFILHGCKTDFILLTGKPVGIHRIRDIFVNDYPNSPDRIISLSNYQIGTWYPFTDPKGFITDPKTTVAVGAMIYSLAGRFKQISHIKLNTKELNTKLISTANYLGEYNILKKNIDEFYFTPKKNDHDIKNISLPIYIGVKQFQNVNYPSKPLYILNFNINYFRDKLQKEGVPEESFQYRIEEEINKYKLLKYDVNISRNFNESKEDININTINDVQSKTELNKKLLSLTIIPPNFENEYWMDTGEFKVLSHY